MQLPCRHSPGRSYDPHRQTVELRATVAPPPRVHSPLRARRALHACRSGSVSDCAERGLARRHDSASGRSYLSATVRTDFIIRTRISGSGYLTVTTTEMAKIPDEGTRITPAYNPLLPTIQAAWTKLIRGPRCYVPDRHATRSGTLSVCWRKIRVCSNESESWNCIRWNL